MYIKRGTLIALFALPLVLAAVFGWIVWDMKTLSDGELKDVVSDAMKDLEGAHYDNNGNGTAADVVREAVEDSAQAHAVPLPRVVLADSRLQTDDNTKLIHEFQVAEGIDNDGHCITLTQSSEMSQDGVQFDATLENSPCPHGN